MRWLSRVLGWLSWVCLALMFGLACVVIVTDSHVAFDLMLAAGGLGWTTAKAREWLLRRV